jgi:predicted porin
MKYLLAGITLAALACTASAQSTVSISGVLKVAASHGNGGSTPIDGATQKGSAMNDLSSALIFSGREDLGDGLYAGFDLAAFLSLDNGSTWASSGGPFFSRRSVVKLGGTWGELYLGRALTPQSLMALFADPWYWDGSAAQAGWQVQLANYTGTSYLRTNNTLGYVSPKVSGLTFSMAYSLKEGAVDKDVGASLTYDNGPLWLGLAHDRSHGFTGDPTLNHSSTLVAGYDFGVVRPLLSYTASRVRGVDYKGWTLAATAPLGAAGSLKAHWSQLDDADTATPAKEKLQKLGLGYTYAFSKRSSLFTHVSHAKAEARSATRTVEAGIEHAF